MSQNDKGLVVKLLLCSGIVVSGADIAVIVIAIVAQLEGSCRDGFFPLPIWLIVAASLNIVSLIVLLLCIVRLMRIESEEAMRHVLIANTPIGIAKAAWLIIGIVAVIENTGCNGIAALAIVELIWLGAAAIASGCVLRYSNPSYDTIE